MVYVDVQRDHHRTCMTVEMGAQSSNETFHSHAMSIQRIFNAHHFQVHTGPLASSLSLTPNCSHRCKHLASAQSNIVVFGVSIDESKH